MLFCVDVKFGLLIYGRESNIENRVPRRFFIPKCKIVIGG
jgi:hypothetical protein